nr:hypothetical protein [Bacillota bacterium]
MKKILRLFSITLVLCLAFSLISPGLTSAAAGGGAAASGGYIVKFKSDTVHIMATQKGVEPICAGEQLYRVDNPATLQQIITSGAAE